MKFLLFFLSLLFALPQVFSQAARNPVAQGVYRIPYADGTKVRFSNDHTNHPFSLNRIDMRGVGTGGPFIIVAAADGIIRSIRDDNSGGCGGKTAGDLGLSCGGCNNYVWIEHPNGEWTKYTHFVTGSVTALGHFEGESVCSGDALGIEGDVGATSGGDNLQTGCDAMDQAIITAFHDANPDIKLRTSIHLHFEVAIPNDLSDPHGEDGGFLRGDGDGDDTFNDQNRIAFFCGVGVGLDGNEAIAGPCSKLVCPNNRTMPNANLGKGDLRHYDADIEVSNGNNVHILKAGAGEALQAGSRIVLKPGFKALTGSDFTAAIARCQSPGASYTPFCNIVKSASVYDLPEKVMEFKGTRIYPNPSAGSFNFEVLLEQESQVSLQIFDAFGRLVKVISDKKTLPAGNFEFLFEAQELPSGNYFGVLFRNNEKQVYPLQLMR